MKLDTASLEHIDSFPYRHKVAEVMAAPVIAIPPEATLVEAARMMADKGISSILVTDKSGLAAGIVTERDVLRAVAHTGSIGLHQPVGTVMSSPVATVREEALVFVALGRMERMKIRHLCVVDRHGHPVGIVSARSLLKLRAGTVLAIGDEIVSAPNAQTLAQARAKAIALAQSLVEEDIGAIGIANVVSTVERDVLARSAELAEQSMALDGWGPPPVPGCLLALGPIARGESLFGMPQANAIIYEGGKENDAWYAEISKRICDTLELAGIARNPHGVMCAHDGWRKSLADWKTGIEGWMQDDAYLDSGNIGIFADFRVVYGTASLGDTLRDFLLLKASGSATFAHKLAIEAVKARAPLGMFGNIQTVEGRFDLKPAGLLRLTGLIRALSLKHGIESQQSRERIALLAEKGVLSQEDVPALAELHDFMTGILLRQQLADMKLGLTPSHRIDPDILSGDERERLKEGFARLNQLAMP
jgi:signal-transduction protein with cAMP-binding, CBS, and nucleotidyltransferase domain